MHHVASQDTRTCQSSSTSQNAAAGSLSDDLRSIPKVLASADATLGLRIDVHSLPPSASAPPSPSPLPPSRLPSPPSLSLSLSLSLEFLDLGILTISHQSTWSLVALNCSLMLPPLVLITQGTKRLHDLGMPQTRTCSGVQWGSHA